MPESTIVKNTLYSQVVLYAVLLCFFETSNERWNPQTQNTLVTPIMYVNKITYIYSTYCRGLTRAIYILCIEEHLRMLRLSRESNPWTSCTAGEHSRQEPFERRTNCHSESQLGLLQYNIF